MKISHRGFTLIELLIVIVIIGVMAVMVGPSLSTGSDYAQLKAASRGVVQLSRYSKTMALLHQKPVDLVYSSDGKICVEESAGGAGKSLVSSESFGRTNLADDVGLETEDIIVPPVAEEKVAGESGAGSRYEMADLAVEKEYQNISYRFEGYTDTIDDGSGLGKDLSLSSFAGDADEDAQEVRSFKVHYKSNGTCRPYRVRLIAGGDEHDCMVISVNMLGSAKVLEEDEI